MLFSRFCGLLFGVGMLSLMAQGLLWVASQAWPVLLRAGLACMLVSLLGLLAQEVLLNAQRKGV